MSEARKRTVGAVRALRTLWLPPWRRAPGRAISSPSLLVSVVVAAFVLGLAGASRPMFESSAAVASLRRDLDERCAYSVGLRIEREVLVTPALEDLPRELALAPHIERATRVLDDAVRDAPGIDPAVVTIIAGSQTATVPDRPDVTALVQLVQRDGFRRHIAVLDEGSERGVWVPDVVAEDFGIAPGDDLVFQIDTQPVTVPVAGTFQDLRAARDDFWCSMSPYFAPRGAAGGPPPPVVLFDDGVLQDVLGVAGPAPGQVWWEYAPRRHGWDLSVAREAMPRLAEVEADARNLDGPLGSRLGYGTTSADVPGTVGKAEEVAASVESVAGPVAVATAGVALVMLLAAARSWLARRTQEITVLSLRGAGPGLLSVKAIAELLPALALGVGGGMVSAIVVVRLVGPERQIAAGAVDEAVGFVVLAVVVTLAAVAVVVAAGVRRVGVEAASAVAPRTALPLWEVLVLGLAVAALYDLRTAGSVVEDGEVDGMLLVFPLLLLAGGSGLVARLVLARRPLDWVARRTPPAGWLAARRLGAGRLRAVLIMTGAAVSIGIVVFAGSLSESVSATSYAKATLGPGSQQVLRLPTFQDTPEEAPLPGASTVVIRTAESTVGRSGRNLADVVGVDPETFADAAYWDGSFASRSLASLLGELRPTDADEPVRAIAVGQPPGEFSVTLRDEEDRPTTLSLEIVAEVEVFPGMGARSEQPLVVVHRDELTERGVDRQAEVWLDDPDPQVGRRLADEAGWTIILQQLGAADVEGNQLQSQLWAVDYLEVIGLAAGVVTLSGLGLYFAANARRRQVGAVLARRLGMRSHQALFATVLEVSCILGTGLLAGIGWSWLAIRLVHDRVDPVPQTHPDPILRFDLLSVGFCAAGVLVTVLVATSLVERRAARASLPELLRDVG